MERSGQVQWLGHVGLVDRERGRESKDIGEDTPLLASVLITLQLAQLERLQCFE